MKTLTKLKINFDKESKKPTFSAVIVHNKNSKLVLSTLLGRSMIDWVSFACESIPHRVINVEENENLLKLMQFKLDINYDYTIVLNSNTPLISQDTIKEIIEYATYKNILLCKLPVGYVIKNKEFSENSFVDSVYSGGGEDFYQVENKKQLNHAIDVLQDRINAFHINNGVDIKKPRSVYIEPMVDIADGVVIYPNNSIKGSSVIGGGVILKENNVIDMSKIGKNSCVSGSVINKSIIADNVYIASFCEINNSLIDSNVIIETGCAINNYKINSEANISANSILGDTNDSGSGTGQSR